MKKRRKTERGRTRKRKGAQLRSAATTPEGKALRESEANFRSLVESAAVPICISDLSGDITYVSKALADLGGYTVQELVGHPFMDFLHPEDREVALSIFKEAVSTSEEVSEIKFRVTRRNGQFLTLACKPTRIEIDGKTVGFQAIITDITERKRAEEALRESEDRLRRITGNMLDIVVETDLQGICKYASQSSKAVLGYDPEDLVGKSLFDFVHPEDLGIVTETIQRAISTGRLWTGGRFECRYRHADDHYVWLENLANIVRDEKGQMIGSVIASRDITERKESEEALRESEGKYRKLFEEAMDGIALADTDAGILFDCNQALAALVGRNRAELIGQPQTILHPTASDSSAFSPTFKLHATTREGQVLETQVITATGEIREVEIKASLLYLQGKKMMQGIFHDITERKRAEEALRRSEERYRLIAENMTETVWLMDMNLKPTYISPSAVPLRGYTLEELYALPLDRQLTPDSLKLAWETFKEALSEENLNSKDAPTSITLELEFYRKNGSTFWNESTFTLARNSKGEPAGILGVGRDITERKRLESELKRYSEHLEEEVLERTKKLAESEGRFREMADLLPQPVFEMDEKGNITFLNRAGFETTGYDEDDLKAGLNAFQVIARESHKLAREEIGRILSGESSPGNEYVFVRKDGSQLPVISHASSILKGGKVVGLRGVIIDITERKRIEDSLRESAEKYRDLFENANDLVQCVDGDGRFALVNRKWLETLGYSREALKQLTLMDILRKDQVPHCMELFGRVRNGEVLDNVETVFLSKDGREILVEGNVNGQFKDGQFVTTRGIFRDVTERKRMEEALRESEERLETIFDSVRTGIMIIDSKTHLIVDANPAATEMAGAPKEQIVGSVCHKYVCPAEKGRCPITDLGQTVDNAERVFLRVNGKTTPVMKSVRRIVLGGQEHLLESFIDITEHKRLEAQLAESQRLAGIGEAAAMVGHDLRNPLQGIVSTIYLAKRKLESSLESSREAAVKPGLVDMLETIENEVKYMDKIVSDLQDYAAPLKAEPKPVEMEPLVKDTLSKICIPQNVKVSLKVSEALQRVMIDPAVMRRVFTNLIMNAIQAMPDGGELGIDLYGTDEFLFVAFKDIGVGMPEEDMGELFNPFFTTKAKGQGLGLAVCKRLVEAQNGWITVESKLGEGSTFTVKLPFIKP